MPTKFPFRIPFFVFVGLINWVVIGVSIRPVQADYGVEMRGTWPEDWPDELDSLRDSARSFEGPLLPLLHYGITFKTREEFELAWPHLLSVKSPGAPIVLKRGTNFWIGKSKAGVCIHTPPAGTKPISVPFEKAKNVRPEQTIYIELIVDGKIVDLNRIPLPANTLIKDERFTVRR